MGVVHSRNLRRALSWRRGLAVEGELDGSSVLEMFRGIFCRGTVEGDLHWGKCRR